MWNIAQIWDKIQDSAELDAAIFYWAALFQVSFLTSSIELNLHQKSLEASIKITVYTLRCHWGFSHYTGWSVSKKL